MKKHARLLSRLKSVQARRRFLILVAVGFVLALSWASVREFSQIASDGGGLAPRKFGKGEQDERDERNERDEPAAADARTVEGDAEYEDDGDDEDEGDYYGGEMNVRSDEVSGGAVDVDVDVDADPPPQGAATGSTAHVKDGGKKKSNNSKDAKEGPGSKSNESSIAFTVLEHTDFYGDQALVWGSENMLKTADECSRACSAYKPSRTNDPPCNLWVFCGDERLCSQSGPSTYQQCWLKFVAHPDAAQPSFQGPSVGWTSGIARSLPKTDMPTGDASSSRQTTPGGSADRTYHVVISAQGGATHWQSRIHYYWYLKTRKQCQETAEIDGTTCDMGGFTRLLHEDEPDDLMDEIPTFVAKTLPEDHPHHGYIVLNRPYAFLQWVQQATIKEKYVLMGEPDHIWLKPLPNPMVGELPAAFPFFYIEPTSHKFIGISERFVGKLDTLDKKTQLFPIGSSPTIMSLADMKRVVPIWYELSLKVHEDEDAVAAWGWVQEMYAFSLAMYKAGLHPVTLLPDMMAQPPWDWDLYRYTLLHYTYGLDYTLDGVHTPGLVGAWHWDKRDFRSPIPLNMEGPPEGTPNDLAKELIRRLNEATCAIPMWDLYSRTFKVTPWRIGAKVIDGENIVEDLVITH